MLTDKQKDFFKRFKYNTEYFAERYLWIKTKKGELIPFKFNKVQAIIDKKIEELRSQGKPVRILVLKARQHGVSTYAEAKIYHVASTRKNINAEIIAHKSEASTNLFNMSKLYYDHFKIEYRPMIKASNAKELLFENPTKDPQEKQKQPGLRSKIKISSAENREAGRSGTIQLGHLSELAFWPDPMKTMTALMQAIPNVPESMVIIESTANGVENYYHQLWQDAEAGRNDWTPLFFPWFINDEYQMPASEDFKRTGYEESLSVLHGVTDDQLMWRRWCIKNNCRNDDKIFQQEYPATPEEAFLASGRPRFDVSTLKQHYEVVAQEYPVQLRGNIILDPEGRTKVEPNDYGYINFYKKKDFREQYAISADIAEGLDPDESNDPDYTCAIVWELSTMEPVAVWHGRLEPALFGAYMVYMGRHWNNAVLIPERNNHGIAVIAVIRHKYHYPDALIHVSRLSRKVKAQDKYVDPEARYGFHTTMTTRPVIIDNYAYKLANHQIPWIPKENLKEHYSFIVKKNGRAEADKNQHDDRIITTCIGYYVAPNYVKYISDNQHCGNCREWNQKEDEHGWCRRSERWCSGMSVCRLWKEKVIWEPSKENPQLRYPTGYLPGLRKDMV